MARQRVSRSVFFTGEGVFKFDGTYRHRESIPFHSEVYAFVITAVDGTDCELSSVEAFDTFDHDVYCTRIQNARCTWQGKVYEMRITRIKVKVKNGLEGVTHEGSSSLGRFSGRFHAEAIIDEEIEVPDPEPDPKEVEPISAGGRAVPTGSSCMGGCFEGFFNLLGLLLLILLLLALLKILGPIPFLLLLGLLALLLFGGTLLALLPSFLLRLFRWLFGLFFGLLGLFFILSMLSGLLSFLLDPPPVVDRTRTDRDRVEETEPPELEPIGEDTLIVHHLNWNDQQQRDHNVTWRVSLRDARRSWRMLDSLHRHGRRDFNWTWLYGNLASHDHRATTLVSLAFDSLANDKDLDRRDRLEAMVTCVQSIPYSFVNEGPCPPVDDPCKPGMPFGVNPPAGFVADLKGDCDTRSLLLYGLLQRAGYDVAIMLSERYAHAMLGVAVPGQGAYLTHRGKRYYFWETTYPGHRLGDLHPRMRDLRFWRLVKPDIRTNDQPPL